MDIVRGILIPFALEKITKKFQYFLRKRTQVNRQILLDTTRERK